MDKNYINVNSDDTEIIESFRTGNDQAFNHLVRKYQKRVYWVVRKMISDHDDADDITQEVFIRVYKSINEFRGDSSFFTYLYRIAINLSLNFLNKRKRMNGKRADFDFEISKFESNESSAENLIDRPRNEKLFKSAIEQLPEQQRAVFVLRFYDNLTYDEISKILNRSVGGLKANYFHAVKKLQVILKPHLKDLSEAI
ncbi:MAG: sigma-70 family RNA polymerase sigma factor [Ignavibacteriaceae bacterium]|nr:sigma-70 family RNA polymerase sigma factor [Ignavibacteria bacterium]MEB2329503.1 sigma-70 family RNA polymerase sigma factor [Ignavibacteriaceae bacterium]